MNQYKKIFPYKESFIFFRLLNSKFKDSKLKESTLSDFTYDQLQRAGLFGDDSDYEGTLGDNIMELMNKFCDQRHSGHSAGIVRYLFNKLSNYEPINPIEDPMITRKYNDVSIMSNELEGTSFQSTEISNMFSNDGGKSWYILVDVPQKDENGISYCTYEKKYIKEFPFNYDDYIK